MVVADVDHGYRPWLGEEQPPLGLEVGLEVAMEIEVVVAEVREHENGEADSVEAMKDGRVRRRLHRARSVTDVQHLAEQPLQVDRLGGRAHHAPALPTDARLDRPEQARAPAGGCEDREQEEARGGLAARSRDADDLQLAGRLAEEDVGSRRHRRAGVGDDDLRHRQVEPTLHHERNRPAPHSIRSEIVPVGVLTRHGEEEVARRDGPSVVGEITYLDRRASEHLQRLERCDQALQVHPAECTRAR